MSKDKFVKAYEEACAVVEDLVSDERFQLRITNCIDEMAAAYRDNLKAGTAEIKKANEVSERSILIATASQETANQYAQSAKAANENAQRYAELLSASIGFLQ